PPTCQDPPQTTTLLNATASRQIDPLSLHAALPILCASSASTGLCGGCRVTGIPTATSRLPGGFALDHRNGSCFRTAEREAAWKRSEEHTSELQSRGQLVCRLLLDKKKAAPPRLELS